MFRLVYPFSDQVLNVYFTTLSVRWDRESMPLLLREKSERKINLSFLPFKMSTCSVRLNPSLLNWTRNPNPDCDANLNNPPSRVDCSYYNP